MIDTLAIEITRRCNIACEHCLRGDAQDVDILPKYIDSLFKQINCINHLAITGGEPSLKPDAIAFIVTALRRYNVSVDTFFIATNGVKITKKFVDACWLLYEHVENKEHSSVEISNDEFHIKEKQYEDIMLLDLPFYRKRYKEEAYSYPDGISLHKEGRGNAIKRAKKLTRTSFIETKEDFMNGVIYLNVNGELINGCDWSYENQRYSELCRVEELTTFYNELEGQGTW